LRKEGNNKKSLRDTRISKVVPFTPFLTGCHSARLCSFTCKRPFKDITGDENSFIVTFSRVTFDAPLVTLRDSIQ
ncbi:MAG: hypothetical protein OEV74_04010, partial [Cyclobacteriaceae bacterium]|nr:hypothetical protein [Cyclobacteriaceae bacterium]